MTQSAHLGLSSHLSTIDRVDEPWIAGNETTTHRTHTCKGLNNLPFPPNEHANVYNGGGMQLDVEYAGALDLTLHNTTEVRVTSESPSCLLRLQVDFLSVHTI